MELRANSSYSFTPSQNLFIYPLYELESDWAATYYKGKYGLELYNKLLTEAREHGIAAIAACQQNL